MGNLLFPALPGLEWNRQRTAIWSNGKRPTVSGRLFTVANYSYPRYKYHLSYSVLRQSAALNELQQIVGLFNQCMGDFDSFLWTDPDDCTATSQVFGVGDGANRQFQLVRTWGGFVEPVFDINGSPAVWVDGVQLAAGSFTVSATGVLTLAQAPVPGALLTWSGSFYRRVHFSQGTMETNKFMQNLWDLKKVEFESWKA